VKTTALNHLLVC